MAQLSPDFDLPDEILSVIPTDPYDQLDLARRITSMAIASRVAKLETEAASLRQKVHERDILIQHLEEKVSHLNSAYRDSELQLKVAREDNLKILKERDSIALNAKKLSYDLAKLETFKRQLMQSLNDDNLSQAETVDIGTYDQTVPQSYSTNDDTGGYQKYHSYNESTDGSNINTDVSKQANQKFSITPYLTPRRTPSTPKVISTSVSPRRYSAACSPRKTSVASSPTRREGGKSLSSLCPSSQRASAANSPTRGCPLPARAPRMDGKEFFRLVRHRLSIEQFTAFLANVKELNAQKQSREVTLKKAEEILGTDNKDLYLSFQGLLNRNMR